MRDWGLNFKCEVCSSTNVRVRDSRVLGKKRSQRGPYRRRKLGCNTCFHTWKIVVPDAGFRSVDRRTVSGANFPYTSGAVA